MQKIFFVVAWLKKNLKSKSTMFLKVNNILSTFSFKNADDAPTSKNLYD